MSLDVLLPGQEQLGVAVAHKEGITGNGWVPKPDSALFQLNDCVGPEILDGSLQIGECYQRSCQC